MSLHPRSLPKIRHQSIKAYGDQTDPTGLSTATVFSGEERAQIVDHLTTASLYWVSADMAALAVHAGGQLETASWARTDRPSDSGLVVFDGGVGMQIYPQASRAASMRALIDSGASRAQAEAVTRLVDQTGWGTGLPIDALTWGGHDGTCTIGLWSRRERTAEAAQRAGLRIDLTGLPPLLLGQQIPLPVPHVLTFADLERLDLEAKGIAPTTILRTLAAAWHLMQQPTLADRVRVPADKQATTTAARLGYSDPAVTVVDLRRLYVPDTREETGVEGGRAYRHRWVVSGHWRHYTDERYTQERRARPEWIESHVKGPDGAPLLVTEKVNVWRR